MNKCILVYDRDSRKTVRFDVNILLLSGVEIVQDIDEINIEKHKASTVFVLDAYIKYSNYNKLRFFCKTSGIEVIHLYQDSSFNIIYDFVRHYQCSYADLSVKLLQSAIYNESTRNEDCSPRLVQLADEVLKSETNDSVAVELAKCAKDFAAQEGILENDYATVVKELQKTVEAKNAFDERMSEIAKQYVLFCDDVLEQSRIIEKYSNLFANEVANKIFADNYQNPPKIIYFKEYQEIYGEYQLIQTLVQTLTLQYQKIVKVVALFDSIDNLRYMNMPKYYKQLGPKYNTLDVLNNQYVVKSGDYNKLFDILLNNVENVDYLIVLDCKGSDDLVMPSAPLHLGICRDYSAAVRFKLPNDVVVLDKAFADGAPEGVKTWEFSNKEESAQSQFMRLSASDTVTGILRQAELVFGGI